jgi:FMN phosphatase YigB (HAD superfamily)
VRPARAAFIGDRWRDLEAGLALGGRAALIEHPDSDPAEVARARAAGAAIVRTLDEAVRGLLAAWRAEDAA